MSPVGSPPRNPRRHSQQHHPSPPQDHAMPSAIAVHDEALEEDDSFSANPLAFTPGLFHSLDALNDVDDGTLDQFKAIKANLDQRNSHSPSSEGQTRSTVSPDPSSGAPFNQRRRSSERDNILNAHNANASSTFGEVPNGGAARPMPHTALSDGSGSEPITIAPHAPPHSAPGRPSPPLSGAAGSSSAFDVSYNGPPPATQFNFANPHAQQQQQNWMQPSDPSTSTPFDPSQVISFASGSPPFPDSQIQHQRQMIRGAVIQGMQQSRTQSQGPLHISTPSGNNLASTTLQTQHPHPGLSVSPSYPPEFTFPANRDSGGAHAAAGADGMMGGAMPPSATSPSPSPSFSSSSVSTPVYNGPNPNFLQSGNAAGGASSATAPLPPPTMHHPNPHKVSQSSLRSSSRPSPTPESASSRESGHPYPAATRHHGGRTRRHPSDPNQLQTAQQHGGVAPDMSVYNTRRTSLGPGPMPPRMTPRRSGMSPTIPPGRRYEQDQMMASGPVQLVNPNQQLQFANVQQWTHGVHTDQSLNSPPSNGPERPRPLNRGSSSATSSESSLAQWSGSAEDLHRYSQQAMEIQSPMVDAGEWSRWNPMAADRSMLQQTFNGTFDPQFAGLPDGPHYSPAIPAIAEDGVFPEGLFPAQSPKHFVPVSPSTSLQAQQAAWGPQTLSASMGLQGLQQ